MFKLSFFKFYFHFNLKELVTYNFKIHTNFWKIPSLQKKVTEKFKRPFKKRHSSVYHQPSNRVNKYLAQAIDARSVDREKSTHVNLWTLCFKDSAKEHHVRENFLLFVWK